MENILDRIKKICNNEGISVTSLEQKIGASKGVLSRAIANGTDIQYKWVQTLVENYPLYSTEWLLTGTGEMLKSEQKPVIINSHSEISEGIPLYNASASAGYGSFDEMISGEKLVGNFIIPGFKNIDWMIYVAGSSMYPKYSSGDIIACRVLHESQFIQWGKVYVVATREQGILVKRLKESPKEDCIKAISDNPNYDSFDIPKDEILGIALVVGVVRLE
jgi:phage repressor protein C with HTH and peptisase S24 domain